MKHSVLISRLVVAAMLGLAATLACAEPGTSADELLTDADRVLQQVDTDHYADVWKDTAPFVRAKLKQDEFVTTMRLARHEVGAVSRRGWASVTRIRYSGTTDVPDGLYANVDYATTLADGHSMVELLSFRLEPDGRWYLTGYRSRQSQGANTEISKP